MPFDVIFAPTAIEDLADSVSYIARFDKKAAARIGDSLISAAESKLSQQPRIGPRCLEYSDTEIRYWLHRDYRIVYQLPEDSDRVEVLRFWHCSRGDWPIDLD